MKKKSIISICLVVAIAFVAIGGATLAYFTDNESASNVFTVGNVDITLEEPSWDPPTAVVPGITYPKDPTVENVGKNDSWVRVSCTVSDYAAFKAACDAHQVTDLTTIFGGFDDSKWTLAKAPVIDTEADTITYSYYYNTILKVGANTGALFTSVTVPSSFTNVEMAAIGDDFTIDVTADAIQSEGFDTVAAAFAAFDAQ